MSGHTPGPWFQSHRETRDGFYSTEVYDQKGETIATVAWYPIKETDRTTTNCEANAYLIAAAPTLLEAADVALACVTEVSRAFDDGDPRYRACVNACAHLGAAINKAEGR